MHYFYVGYLNNKHLHKHVYIFINLICSYYFIYSHWTQQIEKLCVKCDPLH